MIINHTKLSELGNLSEKVELKKITLRPSFSLLASFFFSTCSGTHKTNYFYFDLLHASHYFGEA